MSGINLKLLVVVEDKSKFDPKALNAFFSDKLEKYKIPRVIEAVDALSKPLTEKQTGWLTGRRS